MTEISILFEYYKHYLNDFKYFWLADEHGNVIGLISTINHKYKPSVLYMKLAESLRNSKSHIAFKWFNTPNNEYIVNKLDKLSKKGK